MRKKFLVLIMAIFMIFIVACETDSNEVSKDDKTLGEPKDGGKIVFVAENDPRVLNPLYASDRVTMAITNALYAPLYAIDEDGVEYFLAENLIPSEDHMTYTLVLKDDIVWHDGKEITADDIIFTIERVLDEKQGIYLRETLIFDGKPVEVAKIDEKTVEFKIPKLTMVFPSSLEAIVPLPKHIFENEENLQSSDKNNNPIGSGPFKFKEFIRGESITLERFDEYFRGKPYLDTVVFSILQDNNTANVALKTGEVSANYIEAKDFSKFNSDENFDVITIEEGMLNNMIFNLNSEVLKDKRVRQAIGYAIEKEDVVKASYNSTDYAELAYSVFTPNTLYYTDNVKKYERNIEQAKKLLKEAGYENLKLKIAYINSKKDNQLQALVIQQNLRDVGIDVELIAMDRGAYFEKLIDKNNKDFDLSFNGYAMGYEPDGYKQLFTSGQLYNFMNYSNGEIDELFNKGSIEIDEEVRKEIYEKVQQLIIEDMVEYPIAYPKSFVAIHNKYGGIKEAKPVSIFMFRDLSKLYIKE